MSKKPLFIGANWKMNEPPVGCCDKNSPYRSVGNVEVCVFPSFIDVLTTRDHDLMTGAQFGHPDDSGAFTGDISMKMLKNQRLAAVLCGHSERRQHHEESNEMVAAQTESALRNGLIAVVCIGENYDQRQMDETHEILEEQLGAVFKRCKGKMTAENCIIAYEPTWAVGTSKTPEPTNADATHAFIRGLLPDKKIRIIYGGSVTSKNAAAFFSQPNIDGGLIGGAALKPDEFAKIVEVAQQL